MSGDIVNVRVIENLNQVIIVNPTGAINVNQTSWSNNDAAPQNNEYWKNKYAPTAA